MTKPYHTRFTSVVFKLDTGAEASVMPLSVFQKLFLPQYVLGKPIEKLKAYRGTQISNLVTFTLFVKNNKIKIPVVFNVTEDTGPAILGNEACIELGLVTFNCVIDTIHSSSPLTKEYILKEYSDVFNGIGHLGGEPYHIQLGDNAEPVVNPPRSVAIDLQDQFQQELEHMKAMGIISPVTQPTEWVNAFVVVEKSEGQGLRICLDPRELNKNIKREHYYTRTIDDILPKVAGAKYFSVLDARSGYWMVELDEDSSLLTTFSTPFGRFKFNRLPFGIVVSQDVFQRKMDKIFGDLSGTTGIADDTFVYGADEKSHDENIIRLLERAKQKGVKFNPNKLQLKVKETTFFGHVWTEGGLKPANDKIDDITNMQAPDSKEELQSFLGMVNYLNRYSPTIATVAAPLRDLLKKDVTFIWNPEHQAAFDATKEEITQLPVLAYYDPTKPNHIQCDASGRGLGAVLLQDGHPVCYASRSLTGAEQRYSNIERELLAVVWSLERFNYYVYAKPVHLQTDHKPLETICKKNISQCSPRLQRMLLRMSKYDVDVEYIPGKTNVIADALSRVSPRRKDVSDTDDIPEISVHYITKGISASPCTLASIKEHTDQDPTMVLLKQTIYDGWPERKSECEPELLDYWLVREDLSVEDGLICTVNHTPRTPWCGEMFATSSSIGLLAENQSGHQKHCVHMCPMSEASKQTAE